MGPPTWPCCFQSRSIPILLQEWDQLCRPATHRSAPGSSAHSKPPTHYCPPRTAIHHGASVPAKLPWTSHLPCAPCAAHAMVPVDQLACHAFWCHPLVQSATMPHSSNDAPDTQTSTSSIHHRQMCGFSPPLKLLVQIFLTQWP